jgi:hypothetical protein
VLILFAMLALFTGRTTTQPGGAVQDGARSGGPAAEAGPSVVPSANPVAAPATAAAPPAPPQPAEDSGEAAPPLPAAATPPASAAAASKASARAPAKATVARVQPAARTTSSPRQLCAGRDRYELLKCMQTQCAKRAWARHEQCVRLRTENKIS